MAEAHPAPLFDQRAPLRPILSDLGLVTQGDSRAWAVTSPDDSYRYLLGRMWDDYFPDDRDWWDRALDFLRAVC